MDDVFGAAERRASLPCGPEEGLELGESVMRRVLEPGDDDVEIFLHDDYESTANLVPTGGHLVVGGGGSLGVGVRLWRDGRCGFAGRAAGDLHDICRLVFEAREDARRGGLPAPPMPEAPPVEPGARPAGTLSVEGSRSESRRVAAQLAGALQGTPAHIQAVLVRDYSSWSAVVSTRGVRGGEWLERRNLMVRCETPAGAVVDASSQPVLHEPLACEDMVGRLAAAVEALAAPGADPDPALPVVLRPAVAAPLVGALGWFLRATTALDMRGVRERLGAKLFPSVLNVVDDPHAPGATHDRLLDDEGLPTRAVTCVEDGRFVSLLHSTATAAAFGATPTGHGMRLGVSERPSPAAVNLHVAPSVAELPDERLELVARVETLTHMPRPGVLTLVVAGWEVRGDRRRRVGPFDLNMLLLPTWRRLRAVGDDLQFLPVADWCGTPTLVFDPLFGRERRV